MPNDDTEEVVSTDTLSVWDSFFINCEWWTWPATKWMNKVCELNDEVPEYVSLSELF